MVNNEENKQEKTAGDLAKYVGLAFQMLIIIGLFTYAGYWLDGYAGTDNHIYTALLSLAGVLIAMYQVIRVARRKAK